MGNLGKKPLQHTENQILKWLKKPLRQPLQQTCILILNYIQRFG